MKADEQVRRHRMCERKKLFFTQAAAERSRTRADQQNQYAYQCPYCACWHLATQRPISPTTEAKRK